MGHKFRSLVLMAVYQYQSRHKPEDEGLFIPEALEEHLEAEPLLLLEPGKAAGLLHQDGVLVMDSHEVQVI